VEWGEWPAADELSAREIASLQAIAIGHDHIIAIIRADIRHYMIRVRKT